MRLLFIILFFNTCLFSDTIIYRSLKYNIFNPNTYNSSNIDTLNNVKYIGFWEKKNKVIYTKPSTSFNNWPYELPLENLVAIYDNDMQLIEYNKESYNQREYAKSFSGKIYVRFGFDADNKIKLSLSNPQNGLYLDDSGKIEKSFVLSLEQFLTKENNIGIGAEYIPKKNIENSNLEIDLFSMYLMYSPIILNENIQSVLKIGYSRIFTFDDNYEFINSIPSLYGYMWESKIGIMYSLGINFKKFQFSYSVHEPKLDFKFSFFPYIVPVEADMNIRRINLSYLFNL